MIILSREEIEAVVDPNEMMDTIEEAYRIFGENEFYMPERPVAFICLNVRWWSMRIRR